MPPETLEDFRAAGLYRVLQPGLFGGYEMDITTLMRVVIELGRGCGSSAWVLSLTAGHNWWAALYPEAAQREFFADDGDLRMPLVVAPQGRAVPVDGGFRLSGRWNYVSGMAASNWLAVNALVVGEPAPSDTRPSDLRMCVLPADACKIHDNWHVLGLRGTGSVQVETADLFVPDRRTLSLPALDRAPPPGAALHANPLYRAPVGPIFYGELAAVAVGIARGAADVFAERARANVLPFAPGEMLYQQPAAQRRLARATVLIDMAERTLIGATDQYGQLITAVIGAGRRIPFVDRTRLQLQMSQAVETAAEAVDRLFVAGGTSAMQDGEPLQRAFRDISALRTHYLLDGERTAESYGRQVFGLDPLERLPGF